MATLVTDPHQEDQLRAEREISGADRFDEVWEGIYVMAPLADDEHQDMQTAFGAALKFILGLGGPAQVRTGVNISDRDEGWKHNYRVPDVAVFLPGGVARNCGTHWVGGPDFAIEIVSSFDRSRAKLSFYEQLRVRELLLVDRDPWALELYRLDAGRLARVGDCTLISPAALTSNVLGIIFSLVPSSPRPQVAVTTADGSQRWLV